VHARPPAFEGADGHAWSVEVLTDETGEPEAPWGAYLFFLRWGRGEPEADAHLETEFLVRGGSEATVRRELGGMSLHVVKATLDGLIRRRNADGAGHGVSGGASAGTGDGAP
jgi:hypothetical protein